MQLVCRASRFLPSPGRGQRGRMNDCDTGQTLGTSPGEEEENVQTSEPSGLVVAVPCCSGWVGL